MGICASSQMYTNNKGRIRWAMASVQVISWEGKLEEYKEQVRASQVLAENPNSLLCSSDSMLLGDRAPPLDPAQELQPGQIYFLLPLHRYSKTPLSLQDFCTLAVKATAALSTPTKRVDQFPSATKPSRSFTLSVLPKARLEFSK